MLYLFVGIAWPHPVKPPDFPGFQASTKQILGSQSYLVVSVLPVHMEEEYLSLTVVGGDNE
jgi:hypothetical protein